MLATCTDIRERPNSNAGFDGSSYDRAAFLEELDRDLAFSRVSWSRLWEVDPPEHLREEQTRAEQDMTRVHRVVDRVRASLRRSESSRVTVDEFNQLPGTLAAVRLRLQPWHR